MRGEVLLPYQREWVAHEAPFSVYLKSRRIGISWAEALWSVRRRLIDAMWDSAKSDSVDAQRETFTEETLMPVRELFGHLKSGKGVVFVVRPATVGVTWARHRVRRLTADLGTDRSHVNPNKIRPLR